MYAVVRLFFENLYGFFEPTNTDQWVYRWNDSTTNQSGRQYETPPAADDDGNLYRCCCSPTPQPSPSTPIVYSPLHPTATTPLMRLLTGAIITLTCTCVGEVIDRRTFKSFGCVRGYYHYFKHNSHARISAVRQTWKQYSLLWSADDGKNFVFVRIRCYFGSVFLWFYFIIVTL